MKVDSAEITLPTEGHLSLRPPQDETKATKTTTAAMNLIFFILFKLYTKLT